MSADRFSAVEAWVKSYAALNGIGSYGADTLAEWVGRLVELGATDTELTAMTDLFRMSPMDEDDARSLQSHWSFIQKNLNAVRAKMRADRDAAEARAAGDRRRRDAGCEWGCTHGLVIVPHYDDVCLVNKAWHPGRFGTCGVACRCHKGSGWRQLTSDRGRLATLDQVERALPNWRELMGQREAIIQQHQRSKLPKRRGAVPAPAEDGPVGMGGVFDEYLKKPKMRSSR